MEEIWAAITAVAAVVAIIVAIVAVVKSNTANETAKASNNIATESNAIAQKSLDKVSAIDIRDQAPNLAIQKDILIIDVVTKGGAKELEWQYEFADLTSGGCPLDIPPKSVTLGNRLIRRNGSSEKPHNQFFIIYNTSEKDTGKGQTPDYYTGLFGKIHIRNFGFALKSIVVKDVEFEFADGKKFSLNANPKTNTIYTDAFTQNSEEYLFISYLIDENEYALYNKDKATPENMELKSRYGGEKNQLFCDLKVTIDLYIRSHLKFWLVNVNDSVYEQTITTEIKDNHYLPKSSAPTYVGKADDVLY